MPIKAVVFDMDGTILHTLPDLTMVTNLAMEEMGFPQHTQEQVLTYVGNGAERLVDLACPDYATPEQRVQTLKRWRAIYLERGDVLTEVFPGIEQLLLDLRARGVKTAVLSNKFDAAVVELADHYFPGLFDTARGEIPPTPRKPDPTSLLQILEGFGVAPEEAMYVGDTSVDVAVAKNAGTKSAGVSWGYDKALPLPVEELDVYAHKASELLEYVDSMR